MVSDESKKVALATEEEVRLFGEATANAEIHEEGLKYLTSWQKQMDRDTFFYLPVEIETDEHGNSNRRIYMEAARDEEPWLSGVIVAFYTSEELEAYLTLICTTKDRSRDIYASWKANLETIHEVIALIDEEWRNSDQGGIRVELHKATDRGAILYVDCLYDRTTN